MNAVNDDRLAAYLGSKHSALGLLLFWFGFAALLGAGMAVATVGSLSDAAPFWYALLYGLITVPLGLSMRRKEPKISVILLGCLLVAIPMGLPLILEG